MQKAITVSLNGENGQRRRRRRKGKKIVDQAFVSRSSDAPFCFHRFGTARRKRKNLHVAYRSPQNSKQLFQESLWISFPRCSSQFRLQRENELPSTLTAFPFTPTHRGFFSTYFLSLSFLPFFSCQLLLSLFLFFSSFFLHIVIAQTRPSLTPFVAHQRREFRGIALPWNFLIRQIRIRLSAGATATLPGGSLAVSPPPLRAIVETMDQRITCCLSWTLNSVVAALQGRDTDRPTDRRGHVEKSRLSRGSTPAKIKRSTETPVARFQVFPRSRFFVRISPISCGLNILVKMREREQRIFYLDQGRPNHPFPSYVLIFSQVSFQVILTVRTRL